MTEAVSIQISQKAKLFAQKFRAKKSEQRKSAFGTAAVIIAMITFGIRSPFLEHFFSANPNISFFAFAGMFISYAVGYFIGSSQALADLESEIKKGFSPTFKIPKEGLAYSYNRLEKN